MAHLQYRLLDKLGDGAYASVYRCADGLGIRYACKAIPKARARRERVQKEIDIMQRLSRASLKVPRYVDALEDDERYFIIMELCRGGPLIDYVGGRGRYAENTVASIVRGVLRALCHLHQAGVVHRDIKAANILLADSSDDADVKLADFGTAEVFTGGARAYMTVPDMAGTPWFMAPEALAHQYAYQSDVWSVGVLAYQLLFGRMPFNDRQRPLDPSLVQIMRSIMEDAPPWVDAPVSDAARDFIAVCLNKSMHERPSARACLDHPWLAGSDCQDRFTGAPLDRCQPFRFEDATLMTHGIWVPRAPAEEAGSSA